MQFFIHAVSSGIAIEGVACLAMLMALRRAGQWRIAEAAVLCLLHIPAFREFWAECDALARHEGQHAGELVLALHNACTLRFAALEQHRPEGVVLP